MLLDNGTPQRNVISSILFPIEINGQTPNRVKISMFTDDTAIWKTDGNVHDVKKVSKRC